MAADGQKTRGSLLERHKRLGMALQDPRTSKGDCVVLSVISEHSDHAGNCWPGLELIARKAGKSRSTAIRATETLERLGYLRIEKESGKSNYYILADTSSIPDTGTGATDDTGQKADQSQSCNPRGATDDTPPVSSLHKTSVTGDTRTQLELSSRNSTQITQGASPVLLSDEEKEQERLQEKAKQRAEQVESLRAEYLETRDTHPKWAQQMERSFPKELADLIEERAA